MGLASCSSYPGDVLIYGSCESRERWQLKPEKGCGTRMCPYGSRHTQGRQSSTGIRMVCPVAPGQPCATQVLHVPPAKRKEQLLQKLPPTSVHPDFSTVLHLFLFPTLPVTTEFNGPTHEGRGKAVNKFLLPAAVRDS